MEDRFYNQPVVNWAQQNLTQPVQIKVLFSSRWGKIFVYLLVFFVPLIFISLGIVLTILRTHQEDKSGLSALACGFVMLIPAAVIAILGTLTRGKFVKSLEAGGVKSSMGRSFLWENLFYIDHVSKATRAGGVSHKIEDNQLEMVFADGKAIIPPLIRDRDRIWRLVNSIPAQVKFDGEIKTIQSPNTAENASVKDFMKGLERMALKNEQNK